MKLLIDTCVLSEIRKPDGNPTVKSAFSKFPDDSLFLSVLTIGEIAKGVSLLAQGQKKQSLSEWLVILQVEFAERMMGVDMETAQVWGELTARLQQSGIIIPAVDGLLAATAIRHGMSIMTRNTIHFKQSGVLLLDPWQ